MAKAFPRRDILFSLYTTLSTISKVYIPNRPTSNPDAETSFMVIDIPGTMSDRNAYQEASLRIDLFKKDFAGGVEDVQGLDNLYKSVIALFPIVTDNFTAISPRLVSGGSDDKGFHYLMVYADILTK
ncbi:MAG TPA: hypothetical protein PLN36_07140 [Bacteroidales bacterium]|nr:hypothetical protein [Bacteroidales bacterium]